MQIRVEDAVLNVEVAGKGRAVVLLHGFPFAHDLFSEQLRALAPDRHVIAPDLRGMGSSSAPPGPYLMESLAADIAQILDALHMERATIVGHSLGGYVALAFFRMFAERVERFCLICSRFDADAPDGAGKRLELAALAENQGIDVVVDAFLPRVLHAQSAQEVRRAARAMMRRTNPRAAAAMLRGMAQRSSSEDLLGEITVPVMLMCGGRDAVVSCEETEEWAASMQDASVVRCAQSAHLPMLEEPVKVSEALLRFTG